MQEAFYDKLLKAISSLTYEIKLFEAVYCVSHVDITAQFKNGLARMSFTLRESVGMQRGSAPPLDFVVRILNSKFWMMESDVWADLLIICRWANPTITIHTKDVTCTLCDGVWTMPATIANCGHTFCRKCLTTSISQPKVCPVCNEEITDIMPHNQEAEVLLKLYYQERQGKLEDLELVCEKYKINFCKPSRVDDSAVQPESKWPDIYCFPFQKVKPL